MEKPRILIVEDENIVAKDLELTLKALGYTISGMVGSGEKAVESVKNEMPDLVLMDIMLEGGMDGIETAEKIRSGFDVPVIYVTAHSGRELLERAKFTEPFGYLLKPFNERELHSTMEMALYKHKIEKEVRESEEWLSATLRSAGGAVIATDMENRVVFMNPVAEELTGWSAEDASERPIGEVFSAINEETGENIEKEVAEAFREGKVVSISGCIMTAKDGREIFISNIAAPIRDDKDNVIGMVQVFRDTTGPVGIWDEPIEIRGPDSVEIRLEGIAQDFNNLLASIFNNIYLAMLYVNPEDKLYKMLTSMEKATLLASHLTTRLSKVADVYKSSGKSIVVAPIAEWIRDAAFLALAESNVRCEYSISDSLWSISVDEEELRRIINNLVINARDAMPEGGLVKVRADNVIVGREDEMSLGEGAYVVISVEDQGAGIPEENLDKIFDPYFTTRERHSRRVAGLGLSIVSSIVKSYGGHINVESEVGVGTNVMVYLPAASC